MMLSQTRLAATVEVLSTQAAGMPQEFQKAAERACGQVAPACSWASLLSLLSPSFRVLPNMPEHSNRFADVSGFAGHRIF